MAASTAIIAPPPQTRREVDPLRYAIAKSTRMRVARETGVGALQRLPANKDMTDFSSNDFLSLANNDEMKLAFLKKLNAMDGPVLGVSGSRLLMPAPRHDALEARIAQMYTVSGPAPQTQPGSAAPTDDPDSTSALFFQSGYSANVGIWSSFPQAGDLVLYDEFIHASAHDGLRLGRIGRRGAGTARSFPHNDLGILKTLLEEDLAWQKAEALVRTIFVGVESVYSMEGDAAPIGAFLDLIGTFDDGRVKLIVDEAHAMFVFGKGLTMPPYVTEEQASNVFARVVTFGKAPGVSGAAVVVPRYAKDYLVAHARPFIFTTAPTVFSVVAVENALDLLEDGRAKAFAEKLESNVRLLLGLLRTELQSLNIPASILTIPNYDTNIPIIPLIAPGKNASSLADHLFSHCKSVARAVEFPAVPIGTERVRVCLSSGHTQAELVRFAQGVGSWAQKFKQTGGLEQETVKARL